MLDLLSAPWAVLLRRPAPGNEGFGSHNHDIISTLFELSQNQVAFGTGLFVLLLQFRQM